MIIEQSFAAEIVVQNLVFRFPPTPFERSRSRGGRYSALFYEDISRYWDSPHHVTGPDVLFVLAGANASTKMGYHGVPDSHKQQEPKSKTT